MTSANALGLLLTSAQPACALSHISRESHRDVRDDPVFDRTMAASSRCTSRCRWPPARIWPSRTPPGWPGSARRSPPTRRSWTRTPGSAHTVAVVTDGSAVLGPRQHRPARGDARDGGQGRAVQAVRRGRRGADLPGHAGRRRDRRGGDRAGARRSAGSTWRTSPRRAASRSSAGWTRRCPSRSSTTTSTAPRSWCSPRCATRARCSTASSSDLRIVISGAGRGRQSR